MTVTLSLSMAAFALAASLSPGPVNLVALSAGTRHGFRASLRHVTGATVGFTLLLVLIGLGLHRLMVRWPGIIEGVRWAGVAFLLYLACRLAADDGRLETAAPAAAPSWLVGATMQWLNPKAWLASMAGMGAYAAGGDLGLVAWFATLFFVICYLSIGCWAYAGAHLRRFLDRPARVRLFNRGIAVLLAASALYLLL
ncbi:Cysteine/O-acetylserine efflux protein [wastewater metagenome]|uniref:Cysteine/O-acetylserine efflux protein n=2 Tax=unclassified sequences TaxID=12908 RepID=A0A5B8R787_9ZZZZ|nr:LysE family transporter [Arhodomonas sp. KWT]QEA03838.1 cysteine/O-acetylserine efflux protein [uncultured organism]